MSHLPLTGLTAATHTPFHADGSLNLAVVEQQAEHLLANGVTTVFIGGSTGESHSLSLNERLALAQQWFEVARGSALRVVVHVGTNCLADAKVLASQAQQLRATAISALAPSYFKPRSVEQLVACAAEIAAAAPETPFYFYDILVLTGVSLSMPDFLEQARHRSVATNFCWPLWPSVPKGPSAAASTSRLRSITASSWRSIAAT